MKLPYNFDRVDDTQYCGLQTLFNRKGPWDLFAATYHTSHTVVSAKDFVGIISPMIDHLK